MKNKKILILLTTTALIIAGCVLGVYLLNKPEKKSVAKNTTKKTEQPDKNKSSNSDTTDSDNTASEDTPTTSHKMTMAEFKKKYPVGSKIKGADGTYTIDDYDNGEVYFYAPDGTYMWSDTPLNDLLKGPSEEQKKADKAYKEGKYPDNVVEHQQAMDKYRKATKDYIDGKLDHQPSTASGDLLGCSTGYHIGGLKVRFTTKGYPCVVTDEGYVLYESMVMPDGLIDFTYGVPGGPYKDSAEALVDWGEAHGHPSDFREGLTYKQLQKIFGKLDKNSKSIAFKEF
ncbi:hypothetical protein SAMN02910400_01591 [Lachnospiraceae bacterium C10]|nr:hypothetical protein SAMN02910400_01591 [Lachnospiraceae bacterium C10]